MKKVNIHCECQYDLPWGTRNFGKSIMLNYHWKKVVGDGYLLKCFMGTLFVLTSWFVVGLLITKQL